MIFAIYHENASEGNLMLLHLMMSGPYRAPETAADRRAVVLEPPLEWVIYPIMTADWTSIIWRDGHHWTLPPLKGSRYLVAVKNDELDVYSNNARGREASAGAETKAGDATPTADDKRLR
jgi:hypothetical protein